MFISTVFMEKVLAKYANHVMVRITYGLDEMFLHTFCTEGYVTKNLTSLYKKSTITVAFSYERYPETVCVGDFLSC